MSGVANPNITFTDNVSSRTATIGIVDNYNLTLDMPGGDILAQANIKMAANKTMSFGADAFHIGNNNGNGTLELGAGKNIGTTPLMNILTNGNVGIGTGSPKNKLDIVGSLGRGAPVTKTTDFTVAATENWLIMNGTATITITLPTASSFTGRELMIKNIAAYTVVSASSNVKPIDTDNAATAILPATAGSWCTLVSDGTNWVTMMN
jgi:hypothetical protein